MSDSPSSSSESTSRKRTVASPEMAISEDSGKRQRNTEVQCADSFSEQVVEAVSHEEPLEATPEESKPQEPLKITHEVRHEVAFPPGFDEHGYIPIHEHKPWPNPAREYPFTLDPFQRLAINCLERNESVLVSAHTSAGKTVVAEYAIAMSLRNKQRVIYTSPIKALSNQKYRELQERFTDVGLMTGDVTLNPDASCLVMTTEILRSMLYRGSEVMREVAWVVFDEIHYMRDKERGVVWEETIILLPHSVRYVFLSATIPNARQFARWISNLHDQLCHVVYTNYRPTPLQHYLYPTGADGIYLVVDEKSVFREDNFRKALNIVAAGEAAADTSDSAVLGAKERKERKRRKPGSNEAARDLYKIVKMIVAKAYQPVIVFSFSKRDCETYAMHMSKLDFNTDDEKRLVQEVFKNAIESLNEEDRKLPQIENILPLLRRGVGIHHSGLLPILKEVIEILFQEGLLKVLFATETFSIGLNMPAKTVVFTSVRKFDGQDFRWISSGEYIQMSGRAGRRGLDTRGIVIMMVDEQMDPSVCTTMIKGQADALNSAFHLTYNMILNLMRVEGHSPDFMLEKSFFQFQSGDSIPDLEDELQSLQSAVDAMHIDGEAEVSKHVQQQQQLERLKADYRRIVNHPTYCLPFLQSGRLVHVRYRDADFGWGVVVNVRRVSSGAGHSRNAKQQRGDCIVDVLLMCEPGTSTSTLASTATTIKPPTNSNHYEMVTVPCTLDCLHAISSIRTNLPADLSKADQRTLVGKALLVVKSKFPTGLPMLDPIKDMKVTEKAFADLLRKMDHLERLVASTALDPDRLAAFTKKEQLRNQVQQCKRRITTANSIVQMDELKARKRVLRRLGYCTDDGNDVITLKGRVACEVSTGDELLLVELIFAGGFTDLSVPQTVSLMSCLVFEEKSNDPPQLRDELSGPLQLLKETARRIVKVSTDSGLLLDEQQYLDTFRPELMEVVWQWVHGARFAKICTLTDVFEGSIIRCMRRLEELLRQLSVAAKAIGNDQLEAKFTAGIALLKRDIVFANSLYL